MSNKNNDAEPVRLIRDLSSGEVVAFEIGQDEFSFQINALTMRRIISMWIRARRESNVHAE